MKAGKTFLDKRMDKAIVADWGCSVTGYITDVMFSEFTVEGKIWGHSRFEDGDIIRTSEISHSARKNGFWMIRTKNSVYVIISFMRGRRSVVASVRRGLECHKYYEQYDPKI